MLKMKYSILLFLILNLYLQAQLPVKVACIGDSVTFGYGLQDPSTESYPSQLQKLLGDDFLVQNFGHSGATLLQKGHKPYVKTQEYQKALDFKPDIAIISLGLNDTDPRNWPNYSADFAHDYSTLIAAVRATNPKVKIYITKLSPIFSGHPRFLSGTRDWFLKIQDLIPQIATANAVGLIDIQKVLKSRIDLFDDFLHPNSQGAGIIAKTIALEMGQSYQELSLNRSLGSHMVLQRNRENLFYGKAQPNEQVMLSFDGQRFSTVVKNDGSWEIALPKMKAGGPYDIEVSCNNQKIKVNDILFGDVYLAAGQSNMAFPLASALGSDSLINKVELQTNLRLYKAVNLTETFAQAWDDEILQKVNNLDFFSGTWEHASKEQAQRFSAIAYRFASKIAAQEKVPIGIIDISVGGSTTESWVNRSDLELDNLLATYIVNWKTSDFMMDFVRTRTAQNLAQSKVKHQRHPYGPGYNFEAGIQHFLGTQLSGVLWYQGESNAHNIELHHHLFKTLVKSWRENFKQDFPFYYVQLPSINRPSWGEFRNSQRILETELKNAHMAVSLDLGDFNDVHPSNKLPIGNRLAALAEKYQYEKSINADYPKLSLVKEKNDQLVLTFTNVKRLSTLDKKEVKGFQLMDEKGFVLDVPAEIVGRKRIKINLGKLKARKILYGYQSFTNANICNEENVPASTFVWDLK